MEKRLLSYMNWGLLLTMCALFLVGVGNLYSASGMRMEGGLAFASFYEKQLIWGLLGVGVMLLTMCFDYRRLRNLAWPFFIVSLVGKTVYGAQRWISLGFMNIQPSEFAKIAVLLLGAHLLARDGQSLDWKNFFQVLAVGLVPCVLIVKQP